LETENDKLIEALEYSEDSKVTEQFQNTLDEESEMIDDVISKISQLKVMKEETERVRKLTGSNAKGNRTITTTTIYLSKYIDIPTYDGDILRWQEFWDTFEATIHKGKYSAIDKMNYLKYKLSRETLDVISGYQLSNTNYCWN